MQVQAASRSTARRGLATPVSTLDGQLRPRIVSENVPGPKGLAASQQIAGFQDNRTHVLVCGESHSSHPARREELTVGQTTSSPRATTWSMSMGTRTWTSTPRSPRSRSGKWVLQDNVLLAKGWEGNMLMQLDRYNHPDLLELAKTDLFITMAMNRPGLGVFPPGEWSEMVGK